ncbi:GntR family transcriptional regulator [Arthrobacter roseus]|uniref:GntR family transcriptional regulator n=1 Tax=Arthrobacter roseus TaxID=136274 RepID=UPI0019660525|nr:DNA-binding transcriptional regulator YhcF (GntR family) [Arthrobacter roseus]
MSTRVTVDLSSPTPPYEQIRVQISTLISLGKIAVGERLPTVRSLALDLGVAVGTVARAYKELESASLIESRRRHGTVVIGDPENQGMFGAVQNEVVNEAVRHLIREGRMAGLEDHTLMELLRSHLVGDTLSP